MSQSVSRLEDWTQDGQRASLKKASTSDDGATYLSYDIFLALSVFGGFLALDHLYLRSLPTFAAKLFVNFTCFGVWWLYDALRAVFHHKVVKLYGVSIPVVGQTDIGAGVFSKPESKKHYRFLTYAIALFAGGIVGADSFLVGDKADGFIRLICFLTGILSPIAIFIWVKKMIMFFVDPPTTMAYHSDYFGYTGLSLKDSILYGIPIVGTLLKWYDDLDLSWLSGGPLTSLWNGIIKMFTSTGAMSVLPAGDLYKQAADAGAMKEAAKKAQVGGADAIPLAAAAIPLAAVANADGLNAVHYVLIGTLVVIILGGAFVTYHRHVPTESDDSPPEPGVFRVPPPKEHAP